LSLALWPCVLLGLLALGIAAARVYVLAWQAPVAAAPLAAALTRQIACGEFARAYSLCRALPRCWAAECAEECLRASEERAPLAGVIEELNVTYAARASAGLGALQTLGRMAFPLALATAILSLSGAFAEADVARVESALSTAVQAFTAGLMATVFCRVGASIVSRQGEARMKEIAAVCRGVAAALAAGARGAPTQP
jgi:hypothetical protein